jgi:hypothetical protein
MGYVEQRRNIQRLESFYVSAEHSVGNSSDAWEQRGIHTVFILWLCAGIR